MEEKRYRGVCEDHKWSSLSREDKKDAVLDLKAHIDQFPEETHSNSYIETLRAPSISNNINSILTNLTSIEEPKSYGYSKGTGLRLGKSFNPIDVTDIKRPAIQFEEPVKNNSGKSKIELYYADNYKSLQKVIRNDIRLSASYLSNSGEYSSSSELDYSFSENSLTIVLRAETDYGEWFIGNDAQLTPEAKSLLTNPDEFSKRYGTRYISSENRINGLYITFTIYNVSRKTKKTFKSSISASVGFGKLNASAKSTFEKIITESSKSNRMSLSISSIGGTGVDSLSTVLENIIHEQTNPLPHIIKSVENVLKTFTINNAWPNEFFVAKMSNFGLSIDHSLEWTEERNLKLIKCKDNYFKLKYKYNAVKEMMNGSHVINKLYDYGDINNLIYDNLETIEEKIKLFAETHNNLLTSPNVNSIKIPDISDFGIADFVLRRFLKLPAPNFQGRYLPKNLNFYKNIPIERIISILNTPKKNRQQVIQNFYPDSIESMFSIAPLGEGISVVKLYYTLFNTTNGEWNEVFKADVYTGPWAGFSLTAMEDSILEYVDTGGDISNSRKDYQIIYSIEIINKAQISTTYEIFRCTWYDEHRKPNNIEIEFNIF